MMHERMPSMMRTALAMAASVIVLQDEKMPKYEKPPTLKLERIPTADEQLVAEAYKAECRVYRGMVPRVDTRGIDVDAVIRDARAKRLERNRKKMS